MSSTPDSGPDSYCDDGNSDPYDACVGHKKNVCGDGALYVGVEECEAGFGEYWTKENCVGCNRTRYEACERLDDCWEHKTQMSNGELAPDLCIDGVCVPAACHGDSCTAPCPRIGNYDVTPRGPYCLIGCLGDRDCPKGLSCEGLEGADFKHCVVHGYTPGYTHYP